MNSILRYNIFFILLLISSNVQSQQNLEFVENKGQWDKSIQFKGEMTVGAFALKPDGGYRMLQYDTTNLKELYEKIHPHDSASFAKNEVSGNALTDRKKNTLSINTNGKVVEPADFNFTIKGHIYEVKFLNANPNPVALPDKPLEKYNNYILGKDSSKWAGNCRVFTAVTYKNIYPNIDIRYYTDMGSLKYDFIINPGGNANDIVMYIDGADEVSLKRGQLSVRTSVGEIKESIPSSYKFNTLIGRKEVECRYKVNGNIVHFNVSEIIDKKTTLIIDPQFVFCTFTGSRSDNWGYSATYDALGNFYAGGIVFGSGFPTTNGAFQTQFGGGNNGTGEGYAGGFDIGIMKFNPIGTKVIYATYIGGSGNEYPHSLVVDANYNLIVSGKTTSSNYPVFPVDIEHYGQGKASDTKFDIILTKLNASGTGLIGSRCIGGTGNDGVNIQNKYSNNAVRGSVSIRRNYGDDSRSEVIIDSSGNIYLASCTQSTDFRVTNNSVHGSNKSGGYNQDAVVLKTSPDLRTVLFSTYLGGNGDDAAFVLALDPTTNLLAVAGATTSTDLPGDTSNTLFPHFMGGVCDGFITLMTNDGSRILQTSYLGTPGNDIVFGVQYDKFGYPYILGTSTGSWPTANASFIQKGAKQFIAKLQKDLSGFIYSTTFGTNNAFAPNISPTAFLVDRCENVYVSGWGGKGNISQKYESAGTFGLSVTRNAIKKQTDGSDFYFFVLEHNATSQLYGSFFGQTGGYYPNHVDGGTSRFDKNGVIYQSVCANCGGGAAFPVTSGVAYPNNGSSGGCNLAAVKIAFNLAGVGAAIRSTIKGVQNKVVGCVPLSVDFIDTLGEGNKYIWNFGDNSPKETTVKPSISHIYKNTGTFQVSVVSVDSTSCNIADTSRQIIKVANNEATFGLVANKTGGCASTTYEFKNTSTALKPFQSNSFTLYFGDGDKQDVTAPQTITHKYPSVGTYRASLWLNDQSYCNAPDSIQLIIRISDSLKAVISTNPVGCAPYDAFIENNSLAGETFIWDFGDGSPRDTTQAITLTHHYQDTGVYTIKLFATDNSTCNITSNTSMVLITKSKPTSNFTYSPDPPESNKPIIFSNESSNANEYLWLFADGDSVLKNHTDTVSHIFNTNQAYRVQLIAINNSGCRDTSRKDIQAVVTPLVSVANALSPNGENRTIQVRGYGIDKIHWVIYNRFGQVVFETSNLSEAWDGRFKGQLQPADVYTYTLDVTFTNRQHYTKTGDITLLK